MANEYITAAALKATLSLTGETYADADITAAIAAASKAIERACGRRFWKDAADVTRYYERVDDLMVVIDDLAAVTSVKTDPDGLGTYSETWTQNSDYVFGPENAAVDSVPWTAIYRITYPAADYLLPKGPRRIQVIGKFGWPAIPDQIPVATSKLAARLMKAMREAPLGIAGFGMDGAAIRIAKTDPDIGFLLEGLKRSPLGANGMGIA